MFKSKETLNYTTYVVGMVGVGKSTLVNKLGEVFTNHIRSEGNEDNKDLELMYKQEGDNIAFNSQKFFMSRFLHNSFHGTNNNEIVDRHYSEIKAFNYSLLAQERLTLDEYRVLDNEFYIINNLITKHCRNDLIIILDGSFETIYSRIISRGRAGEVDSSNKEYFRRLHDTYKGINKMFYNDYDNVIWIDIDKQDLNDEEEFDKLVQTLLLYKN